MNEITRYINPFLNDYQNKYFNSTNNIIENFDIKKIKLFTKENIDDITVPYCDLKELHLSYLNSIKSYKSNNELKEKDISFINKDNKSILNEYLFKDDNKIYFGYKELANNINKHNINITDNNIINYKENLNDIVYLMRIMIIKEVV